ncbi:MAG: hypothetical protein LBG94_03655, partial [Treponema sp.]|nr:hypothetical protein [Treponema sp.]
MKTSIFKKVKKIYAGTESGIGLSKQNKDILDHMEFLVEASKEMGIDKCLCDKEVKKHLEFINDRLGISPIQAVLFSHFLDRSAYHQIQINDIAESIKCSNIRIIKYTRECDELEKKRLIRCSRDNGSISYRVSFDVRESLRKFSEFKPESIENLDINKFFTVLEKFFEERENNELTFDTLTLELRDLVRLNMHLEFCKKITSFNFHESDLTILLCFCVLYANNNDDNIGTHDFEFLFDDKSMCNCIKKQFSGGDYVLIKAKVIDFNNDNGYINSTSWKLSDRTKKELLSELNIKDTKNFRKDLVQFDTISYKKMFYNDRETKEIETLSSLLQEENFRKILERLDSKGMRKGFACLFSGGPGTG